MLNEEQEKERDEIDLVDTKGNYYEMMKDLDGIMMKRERTTDF